MVLELVKIILTWMSRGTFESKYSPRCFWESAMLTGILLKNTLGWVFLVVFLLKMTSSAFFVGSVLNLIFHWKAHLFISSRSLFKLLAVLSGTLTVEEYPSNFVNISRVTANNWLKQESPVLKPDWFSDIRLFSTNYVNIVL